MEQYQSNLPSTRTEHVKCVFAVFRRNENKEILRQEIIQEFLFRFGRHIKLKRTKDGG